MYRSLEQRALVWLAAAFSLSVLTTGAVVAGLRASGEPSVEALGAAGAAQAVALVDQVHEDSWMPMLTAYQRKALDPHADMYSLFFKDHIKFQYPPSSLLVLDLMPAAVTGYVAQSQDELNSKLLELFVTWPSRLACLLAILCAAWLIERGISLLAPEAPAPAPALRAARLCLCVLLGLTFYPLLKSYALGQIQVFLNGLVALALLLHLLGRPVLCGILLSVCCLVKPQYGVVLALALLSRQWRFLIGFGASFALGLAVSLWRFGLRDHLRYLQVLQTIGRRGETFWPNQSVNGLLNRFLGNGDAVNFVEDDFAPYRLGVYLATSICAVVLIGLALWSSPTGLAPRRPGPDATLSARQYHGTLTLALVIAAATMGSPVAWEHHYGTFLAIFALALPGVIVYRPLGRLTAPLFALSYVSISNALLRPELLFTNRWLGLVGSHLFFGSLILFCLVYLLTRAGKPALALQRELTLERGGPTSAA